MRLLDEHVEVFERADVRMNVGVVGDVVAVVASRRRVVRQDPDRADAEVGDVVELLDQSLEVSDAVAVRVVERTRPHLVDDRVLVPERIVEEHARWPRRFPRLRVHTRHAETLPMMRPTFKPRSPCGSGPREKESRAPATPVRRRREIPLLSAPELDASASPAEVAVPEIDALDHALVPGQVDDPRRRVAVEDETRLRLERGSVEE